MARRQETLIYIEKENTAEAEFMSRNFVKPEIKNKAYINALGAELLIKYLASEGIDVSNVHNIHSISKILEKYDIADILLPNIHIDVRVVFDEDEIFIPKSHFELEITPDIYVVLKLDKKFQHTELLGYFKTTRINKKNENDDYYFISKDKLSNPDSLAKFIKNHTGKTSRNISEEDMYRGRELSVALADHNITYSEEKELLELLLLNDSLRESILEFDNFETLSYSAAPELANIAVQEFTFITDENNTTDTDTETVEENEELTLSESFFEDHETNDNDEEEDETLLENAEQEESEIEVETETELETIVDVESEFDAVNNDNEEIIDNNELRTENIDEESIINNDNTDLGYDLLEDNLLENEEINSLEIDLPESVEQENIQEEITDEAPVADNKEEQLTDEEQTPDEIMSVDSILDNTIASINTEEAKEEPQKDINKDLSEILGNVVQGALEKSAAAGAVAATGALAAEAASALTASEEVIKLASVAGDLVDNVIGENIEKQQKNLDRIDYEKTDIAPDTVEIPENLAAFGDELSIVKMEANLEAEFSGEFDTPTDLSALNTVEKYEEESFEQETVDITSMDSVMTEEFIENTDEIVNLENLSEIDSPTKPIENLPEITKDEDFAGIDLPDLSSYTINEDGTSTSPLDNFDTGFEFEAKNDEHLIDMEMNINEISFDDNLDNYDFNTENLMPLDNEQNFESNTLETLSEINDELLDSENDSLNLQDDLFEDNNENNSFEEFDKEELLNTFDENELIQQENEPSNNTLFDNEELVNSEDEQNEDIFDNNITDIDESQNIENPEEKISNIETNEFDLESDIQPEVDFNLETDIPNQTEEPVQESQDWMADTDYENLQDAEIEAPTPVEEFIIEPEPAQKEFAVMENSTVISDKTFTPGEILIDINNEENIQYEGSENLEELYDSNSQVPGGALLQNPGRMGAKIQGKSGLSIGLGIAGTLITLALVGAIGFGVSKMFKTPTEETPQPITDEALPTSHDNGVSEANTLNVNPDNVINMENNTNSLASTPTPTPTPVQKQQTVSPAPTQTTAPAAKTGPAKSFIDIKKLTWEVPDYVSYNPQFKQYFQSVGKSLKLTLTSDLLLAKDYLYSSQVRVSVTFDKDGTFKTSQIIVSSGSQEIDKIVLQTVNQTLKALKAPHSVGNDESTTAILKIYF